ncbi:MAG: GNAT family N-acetyltransferase [Clostridia bacterium]|nr:GNAT family N-acetyltransferase [Clostridia bacterium]
MEFVELKATEIERLKPLHAAYKLAIGEDAPTDGDFASLAEAMEAGRIRFFGCAEGDALVGCCSVAPTFSTFCYDTAGVFEDFYILPEYRHRGIARRLVAFAVRKSGVKSLTVGCADCDVEMYKALGFDIALGNMLAHGMEV